LDPRNLRSLKRLQAVHTLIADDEEIANLISPFCILYDLRVPYSHLTSAATAVAKLELITDRLGLEEGAGLMAIYPALMAAIHRRLKNRLKLSRRNAGASWLTIAIISRKSSTGCWNRSSQSTG
jgi:hypothetical protein